MATIDQDYLDDVLDELEEAETVQDIFDILSDAYLLEECTVGTVTKKLLINNLGKAVKMLKPEPRD